MEFAFKTFKCIKDEPVSSSVSAQLFRSPTPARASTAPASSQKTQVEQQLADIEESNALIAAATSEEFATEIGKVFGLTFVQVFAACSSGNAFVCGMVLSERATAVEYSPYFADWSFTILTNLLTWCSLFVWARGLYRLLFGQKSAISQFTSHLQALSKSITPEMYDACKRAVNSEPFEDGQLQNLSQAVSDLSDKVYLVKATSSSENLAKDLLIGWLVTQHALLTSLFHNQVLVSRADQATTRYQHLASQLTRYREELERRASSASSGGFKNMYPGMPDMRNI